MLVKRAMISNKTKVSSSGYIERCLIFLDAVCTIFNKGSSLATVICKNFTEEFGNVACCCATS